MKSNLISLSMKKFSYLLFYMTIIISAGCQGPTNYFGWRGPERNGTVDDFIIPTEWPSELTKSWQTEVDLGDASPILVGDKIFLHVNADSMEHAICLDSNTGEIVWETSINAAPEVTGGARTHPGPRSTPGYVKDKIITHGAGGVLACLDADDGEILWKKETYTYEVPRFFTSVSPLIINDMCIMHLGGHEKGVIVALDYETGDEVWKIEGEPSTYSSPVLWESNPEQILVQTETDLLGISTDGKILWRIPTPGERMFYNSSTPVFNGNIHYISGQGLGTTAYEVSSSDGAYTIDSLWNNPDFGVSFCTPVVKDGFIYGNDKRFGYIYCLNAVTGQTAWADTTKLNRFAAMFDLGETMSSLPANGELIFFEPNTTEYVELAKYKISDTEVYASPVYQGNMVFVKDEKHITCWELK